MNVLEKIAIEPITAAEARAISYQDLRGALDKHPLVACYCSIIASTICGFSSNCEDFAPMDEDRNAVRKAVEKVAAILRRKGYACTLRDTALDIEWGE